jgi:hypothetical protein
MKKQSGYDKMDESLGMRRGKESKMKQSYKDRRDESMGKGKKANFVKFSLKDNMQSGEVKMINPDCANMGS